MLSFFCTVLLRQKRSRTPLPARSATNGMEWNGRESTGMQWNGMERKEMSAINETKRNEMSLFPECSAAPQALPSLGLQRMLVHLYAVGHLLPVPEPHREFTRWGAVGSEWL